MADDINSIDHQFQDKALAELAAAGVGVHHAGLHFDDRRATEDLYLKKILRVVVATSVSPTFYFRSIWSHNLLLDPSRRSQSSCVVNSTLNGLIINVDASFSGPHCCNQGGEGFSEQRHEGVLRLGRHADDGAGWSPPVWYSFHLPNMH